MGSLSDQIEAHLKRLLTRTPGSFVELRRCDLAQHFACVPSQINYVLETRFTPDRGYFVESRRGGGGYIRILWVQWADRDEVFDRVYKRIGRSLGEAEAEDLLTRLEDGGFITARQASVLRASLRRETQWLEPPWCDVVRAAFVKATLLTTLAES